MRTLTVVIALLAMVSTTAVAQDGRPLELGIDAGVTFGLDDPNVTRVSIPVEAFRIGFFMTDRVSLEPAFSLQSISADDNDFTTYLVELGLLWHMRAMRSGAYVRPFMGVVGFSEDVGGEDDSESQFFAGAGVGLKIPIQDRLAWRLEANFAHAFESGDTEGGSQIGLRVGLSFFTQ